MRATGRLPRERSAGSPTALPSQASILAYVRSVEVQIETQAARGGERRRAEPLAEGRGRGSYDARVVTTHGSRNSERPRESTNPTPTARSRSGDHLSSPLSPECFINHLKTNFEKGNCTSFGTWCRNPNLIMLFSIVFFECKEASSKATSTLDDSRLYIDSA